MSGHTWIWHHAHDWAARYAPVNIETAITIAPAFADWFEETYGDDFNEPYITVWLEFWQDNGYEDYPQHKAESVFMDDWFVYGRFPDGEVRYVNTELWPEWNDEEDNYDEVLSAANGLERRFWNKLPESTTPDELSELVQHFEG